MIERRGRPKEIIQEERPRKYTKVYEDDDLIETWMYNLDKFDKGPISVEIKYKLGAEKRIKERAKENKQIRKTERQMKKITLRQSPKPKTKSGTGRRGRPAKIK
jgi:deoxyadenosine/deoxycytidine kinase